MCLGDARGNAVLRYCGQTLFSIYTGTPLVAKGSLSLAVSGGVVSVCDWSPLQNAL